MVSLLRHVVGSWMNLPFLARWFPGIEHNYHGRKINFLDGVNRYSFDDQVCRISCTRLKDIDCFLENRGRYSELPGICWFGSCFVVWLFEFYCNGLTCQVCWRSFKYVARAVIYQCSHSSSATLSIVLVSVWSGFFRLNWYHMTFFQAVE